MEQKVMNKGMSAVWNGKLVTDEEYWENYLNSLLEKGVTKDTLRDLLIELDMDQGDCKYQDMEDFDEEELTVVEIWENIYEQTFDIIRKLQDVLNIEDTFETRDILVELYDLTTRYQEGDPDSQTILSLFYEDYQVDTSFVDNNQLIFTREDISGFDLRVNDVDRYEVKDGFVVMVGRLLGERDSIALMIICEEDWGEILQAIEENQ